MQKYILITSLLLISILALAFKQVGKEPVVEKPQKNSIESAELIWNEARTIGITDPLPGASIETPLLVKGIATLTDTTFELRLKDEQGAVVVEKTATMSSDAELGMNTFGELLVFDAPNAETGTLEAYTTNTKTGAEENLTIIPVQFKK